MTIDGLEGGNVLQGVTVTTYIPKAASQGANLTSLGLRATLAAGNAGLRIGLDGVNTKISQPRPINNTQATVKGISNREFNGYNWWHDVKEADPTGVTTLVDDIINPVSKTVQQLTHAATGQQIIRNLDGTKSSYANSKSQSDVNGRIFDFAATATMFLGPELAEVGELSKATGGAKQWLRLGRSYSVKGGYKTWGLRWGASPKYLKKIGSPSLQEANKALRSLKFPGSSWKTADPGHFHFFRL